MSPGKLDVLLNYCLKYNVHLIFICETWCKPDSIGEAELSLNGTFEVFRRDRSGSKPGGGVCILVRKFLNCSPLVLQCSSEICACDLFISDRAIRLISCYYPPWSESSEDGFHRISTFTDELEQLLSSDSLVICCGDFNMPAIDWASLSCPSSSDEYSRSKEEVFRDFTSFHGLSQMVTSPTHRSGNTIDLILTNDDGDILGDITASTAPIRSDHSLLSFTLTLPTITGPPPSPAYDFRHGDYDSISDRLLSMPWPELTASFGDDVNGLYGSFLRLCHDLRDAHIPRRSVKQRINGLPDHIALLCDRLSGLPIVSDHASQDKLIADIDRLVTRERTLVETRVATSDDPRDFYRYAQSRMGGSTGVSLLKSHDGRIFSSAQEKADQLAHHFSSSLTSDDGSPIPVYTSHSPAPPLADPFIDEHTVYTTLRSLGSKLTVTPDGLPPIFFSRAALGLAHPLQCVYNLSLRTGTVPDAWKMSYVTPVYKSKGARTDASNYRPISINVIASKVLERILSNHILAHCESNNLLDPNQFGFRPNRSTVLQLIDAQNHWITAFNDHSATADVIYIDFRAAFDVVNHGLLISKLPSFGLSDELCKWFANFLADRSCRVRVESSFSNSYPCPSGVIQGSVVGPLLYLLFTTDLKHEIVEGVHHRTFADDTKIFADTSKPGAAEALQETLSNIGRWAQRWKLLISSSKSATLHLLHDNQHSYTLLGETIPEVRDVKDLGVLFTSDLKPEKHILTAVARAGRTANFVLRAFNCRLPAVYYKAYQALVLPSLLYGSEAWRPWLKKSLALLEKFQRKFIRRVAFKCRAEPDYDSLLPISEILDRKDLKLASSIQRSHFLRNFFVTRLTNTRSRRLFVVTRARNNLVANSFRWRLSKRFNDTEWDEMRMRLEKNSDDRRS
ncbi:uncharacterized protein LOC100908256 [Galendromus occidentalis]|uniref:Uncharacterized protein LOC100908256 n=1 Tax=Galendromus occidentalis TaxID=34638 RepID=A0AAJ6QPB5_9ACAR|nr:uncharacterized protein LOC100908256 [Galendromus occidentalis]